MYPIELTNCGGHNERDRNPLMDFREHKPHCPFNRTGIISASTIRKHRITPKLPTIIHHLALPKPLTLMFECFIIFMAFNPKIIEIKDPMPANQNIDKMMPYLRI
jgi:hypothetical protein